MGLIEVTYDALVFTPGGAEVVARLFRGEGLVANWTKNPRV
jgi:DNA-directed RNA polymerase subunit E'/Rpb7